MPLSNDERGGFEPERAGAGGGAVRWFVFTDGFWVS